MRSCLILNPNAGGAEGEGLIDEARAQAKGVAILRADDEHPARALAQAHCRDSDLIIVAGGDGTINEVVNGLWEAGGAPVGPAIGVVPLGTGNDLARLLCIPDDPEQALELALKGARRRIDLIRIEQGGRARVAVNACAGGFTGQLNEHLTPELKRTWGPLAYLLGAARTLPDLSGYEVRIAFDDKPAQLLNAFNIVVANGRTAGGGLPAAPRANPEDGLLDVVVIHQGNAAELAALAARLIGGDYLDDEHVTFRRARRLRVDASPGMWFTADGELLSNEPIAFEVLPQALEAVVGPRYRADVVGD